MKNTYFDLIDQTYYFPQEGFDRRDGYLTFHGISLKYLIEKYGTPFKLIYLPRISDQIKKARNLFNRAIKKSKYKGNYYYCYCTKCCHFSHVVKKALQEDVHLETSSSFEAKISFRKRSSSSFSIIEASKFNSSSSSPSPLCSFLSFPSSSLSPFSSSSSSSSSASSC